MAAFNGRRGTNMYPNIAQLNSLETDAERGLQQQQEDYNLDAELELFTNTQFSDFFDMADMQDDLQPFNHKTEAAASEPQGIDFLNADFQIPEFISAFPDITIPQQDMSSTQPLQPYPPHLPSPSSATTTSTSSPLPTTSPPVLGEKRKIESLLPAKSAAPIEDAALAAAEEDKRRRNTAASARFRVKKKQREQAMEKTAREMTERVTLLETRVGQLEMENKILKDILKEKRVGEVEKGR